MPKYDPALRRKRLLRLSIVAAVLLFIGGGIVALFQLNRTDQIETSDEEVIAQAEQAFEKGDYQLVLDLFENPYNRDTTLPLIDGDAELLQMYIASRRKIPLYKNRHITRIVGPLKKLVELDENDRDSGNDLLDALLKLERYSEAAEHAMQLAEKYPDDASVLRKLARAQQELNKPKEALETLYLARNIEPLHVMTHASILDLLQELEEPIESFVEFAEDVFGKYQNDPRAAMIRALAYEAQGDGVQARDLLQQASKMTPSNQETVALLVRWLDRSSMHKIAADYLLQHAESGIESSAGRLAIYRAFEIEQYDLMLDRLKDSDPKDASTDLLAMWAAAHLNAGETQPFEEKVKQLKGRNNAIAQTWASLLKLDQRGVHRPGEVIDMLVTAMDTEENKLVQSVLKRHPYFTQRIGEAYLDALEYEAAYGAFLIAAKNSSTWAMPHRGLTRALLKMDQDQAAFVHAREASRRQADPESSKWLVLAMAAHADPDDADAVDQTLYEADRIDPGTTQAADVQPAVIDLLVRADRTDQATQRINSILAQQPPPSAQLLESLAQLSQQHKLGLTSSIADKLEQLHGMTRGLALIRAQDEAEARGFATGLTLMQQAAPKPIEKSWETAIAGYILASEVEDSSEVLIKLANAYPNDITLQLSALQASDPNSHKTFFENAINRLRDQAGLASIHWRLHQARLQAQEPSNTSALQQTIEDLAKAEAYAPVHFELQLSLARSHMLLGQDEEAVEHARSAKIIEPDDAHALMLLGKALHRLKRHDEARLELIPVARTETLDPEMRLDACTILFEQGERETVQQAIESMHRNGKADNKALVLLVRIYTQQQSLQKADEICKALLKNPDAEAIRFVADFYRQTGRPKLAQQAIKSTQLAGVSKADQLMIRAEDAAGKGNNKEALALILQAAETDPNNISRWQGAVQLAIALGEPSEAVRFAKLADKQMPGLIGMLSIVKHEKLIKQIRRDKDLIPIAVTILQDDRHREPAFEALKITSQAIDPAQIANQLADLSERNAEFKHLAELAMDRLLKAGEDDRAYAMAPSAMARFPDSAASARIATLTSFRMRDWAMLLSAANAWSQRNPNDTGNADLMRAAAMLELDRYDSAVKTLRPYMQSDLELNDRTEMLYELYTRALVRNNNATQAWQLLSPQLETTRHARLIALKRVTEDVASSQTAEAWLNSLGFQNNDTKHLFETATAAFLAGQRLDDKALVLKAEQQLSRLKSLQGTHGVDVEFAHAQIAHYLQQWDRAEAGYRKVLDSVPDNPLVLNNLALVLINLEKDMDEAQKLSERATQISNKDPNLYDTLAIVYLKQQQLELAGKAIDRAITIDPNNANWHLTKADILEAKGYVDRARSIREQYKQLLRN